MLKNGENGSKRPKKVNNKDISRYVKSINNNKLKHHKPKNHPISLQ